MICIIMAKKKGKGRKHTTLGHQGLMQAFVLSLTLFYSETIEVEVLQRAYYIRK